MRSENDPKSWKNFQKITPKTRIPFDIYYLNIALAVAQRSTCLRSGYGAVIVLENNIVSTGYNGSRSGAQNCCDRGYCLRENSKTRSDYHLCNAIHAEQNSLLRRICDVRGATMYISGFNVKTGERKTSVASFPCVNCYRAMYQAGIERIFVMGEDGRAVGGKIDWWRFLEC